MQGISLRAGRTASAAIAREHPESAVNHEPDGQHRKRADGAKGVYPGREFVQGEQRRKIGAVGATPPRRNLPVSPYSGSARLTFNLVLANQGLKSTVLAQTKCDFKETTGRTLEIDRTLPALHPTLPQSSILHNLSA